MECEENIKKFDRTDSIQVMPKLDPFVNFGIKINSMLTSTVNVHKFHIVHKNYLIYLIHSIKSEIHSINQTS